jgi:serine protease Do
MLGKETVKGQTVLAFGSPLNIQRTVSVGWVENLLNQGYLFILHSAAINPGNSGGPLVNLRGELVGINQAMIMANMFVPANGLYVAISVDTIKRFLRWAK